MCDCSQVADEFILCHADSVVGNSDGVGFLISGDVDFQSQVGISDSFLSELQVAQFFKGINGIGNQFTDKNFLVRVERVDDDVQQLLDFSLE